jgi:16S rRNA (guanine966-N2)-methyltransferase
MFDWLGARLALPGELPPICVLDLFCGAGSLGIEALSRGARFCAFVDSDPRATACLRENLDALGIGPEARIYGRAAENARPEAPGGTDFQLVFLDPPYRLSEDISRGSVLFRLLARLGAEVRVEPDALLLWRHDAHGELPAALPGGWRSVARRQWGNMAITMLERVPTVTV